jgi:hypothetical protein
MDIKTAAQQGFTLLSSQYQTTDFTNNFWFAGNTFHTLLDYMIAAGVDDTKQKPPLLPVAWGLYQTLLDQSDWWRDDYGWWGDAFVLAINNRRALGYGGSNYDPLFRGFLTAADNCWTKMQENWTDTAYDAASDNAAGSANIWGGVYNYKNPSLQLTGRNSVSNEGYWLLSMGLSKLQPAVLTYAKGAADAQFWMQQWLARTPTACNGTGQIGILDLQCHVLERPMGTVNAPTWFWTGDQGLFVRALLTSGFQVARTESIFTATMASLKDGSDVLHENMVFTDYYGDFKGDYATGKGIFMRSLIGFDLDPTKPLWTMVMKSAQAVWCNRNQRLPTPDPSRDANQFTFNWNNNLQSQYEPLWLSSKGALDNLIMQAAGQDALNAALHLNPEAQFPCD